MKYKIIFTNTAKQELRDIAYWIYEKSNNIETAKQLVTDIKNECQVLVLIQNRGVLPKDRLLKVWDFAL